MIGIASSKVHLSHTKIKVSCRTVKQAFLAGNGKSFVRPWIVTGEEEFRHCRHKLLAQ